MHIPCSESRYMPSGHFIVFVSTIMSILASIATNMTTPMVILKFLRDFNDKYFLIIICCISVYIYIKNIYI